MTHPLYILGNVRRRSCLPAVGNVEQRQRMEEEFLRIGMRFVAVMERTVNP